jgi:hypothetical protein
MERGLLWLPLLAFFIGLAWIGWREFQKVEAYQTWAKQFDRAKYDIYAVLGQKGDDLTWGKPTRRGPIDLETFSLQSVASINFRVNGQPASLENPPAQGRAALEFVCRDRPSPRSIPFTEPSLAAKWGQHLLKELEHLSKQ